MRAETVARRLLSFARLSVVKVRFEADELGGRVLVLEVAVRSRPRCSRCGRKCPGCDWLKPRRWRHLDFGAWEVQLEATLRRVECDGCGVVVEQVSWTEPKSRLTLHIEELIGWLAQSCDKTAISTMLRVA
jgi:transposase